MWGDTIAIKPVAFCDNWGGLNFVSQNLHNTKTCGVGDMFFCMFC